AGVVPDGIGSPAFLIADSNRFMPSGKPPRFAATSARVPCHSVVGPSGRASRYFPTGRICEGRASESPLASHGVSKLAIGRKAPLVTLVFAHWHHITPLHFRL